MSERLSVDAKGYLEMAVRLAQAEREITGYQIAKDNLELRFLRLMGNGPTESEYELYEGLGADRSLAVKRPAQVY